MSMLKMVPPYRGPVYSDQQRATVWQWRRSFTPRHCMKVVDGLERITCIMVAVPPLPSVRCLLCYTLCNAASCNLGDLIQHPMYPNH